MLWPGLWVRHQGIASDLGDGMLIPRAWTLPCFPCVGLWRVFCELRRTCLKAEWRLVLVSHPGRKWSWMRAGTCEGAKTKQVTWSRGGSGQGLREAGEKATARPQEIWLQSVCLCHHYITITSSLGFASFPYSKNSAQIILRSWLEFERQLFDHCFIAAPIYALLSVYHLSSMRSVSNLSIIPLLSSIQTAIYVATRSCACWQH